MSLYGKLPGADVADSNRAAFSGTVVLLIKYLVVSTAVAGVNVTYRHWQLIERLGADFIIPELIRWLVNPVVGIALLLLLLFKRKTIFAVLLVVCALPYLLFNLPAVSLSVDRNDVFSYCLENFPIVLEVIRWTPWVSLFPLGLFVHEQLPYFVDFLWAALQVGVMIWLLVRVRESQREPTGK